MLAHMCLEIAFIHILVITKGTLINVVQVCLHMLYQISSVVISLITVFTFVGGGGGSSRCETIGASSALWNG